ncbi:Uma2 family endonuclease [Spirulina sp. CCNP1310]|uniref:Uma2 family endonuclease n=1 Tax=Spirulina sp. CCNP1310 TaxID=3110249 RepID=UPI002B21EDF4|nr:Uma2 family endonuclease [Spirulina sp. CCNP1310]MEA5419945.1 Uma2 family endonuclease [Spirulina sp. CCNP1310]
MATPLTASPSLSLSDFLAQPETKPATEYVAGHLYPKPMPKGKHSVLQGWLIAWLNQRGIPTQTYLAFPELRCTLGDIAPQGQAQRSLVPDISVFGWERLPRDGAGEIANDFAIAPDWAIEILSPAQSPSRVIDNLLFCLNYGTKLGWLLDPSEKILISFQPNQQPQTWSNAAIVPTLFMADQNLSVEEIFACLNPFAP